MDVLGLKRVIRQTYCSWAAEQTKPAFLWIHVLCPTSPSHPPQEFQLPLCLLRLCHHHQTWDWDSLKLQKHLLVVSTWLLAGQLGSACLYFSPGRNLTPFPLPCCQVLWNVGRKKKITLYLLQLWSKPDLPDRVTKTVRCGTKTDCVSFISTGNSQLTTFLAVKKPNSMG